MKGIFLKNASLFINDTVHFLANNVYRIRRIFQFAMRNFSETKTNPVDTRESDVTVFETRDNRKIFQYPSIENIQNNKKQGIAESGSKEIQYSANKIGIVKNNELKPSFAQNGQISYDKSNLVCVEKRKKSQL